MHYSTFHGVVDLDYILRKATAPSDVLVISFPGAGGDRFKATALGLGYMMTIGQFNVNALYIKNTDGKYSNSAFIGTKGDFSTENALTDLVRLACSETGAVRCIAVGSSMGGNSALYYGLKYNWDIVAGGARAGTDLWTGRLIRKLIPDAKANGFNRSVYMCWGRGEPMWVDAEQAPSLVALFDAAGIPYEMELFDYSAHVSISRVFPAILKKRLGTLLGIEIADERGADPYIIKVQAGVNASIKALVDYTAGLGELTPNYSIPRRPARSIYQAIRSFAVAVYKLKGRLGKSKRRISAKAPRAPLSRPAADPKGGGKRKGGKWVREMRDAERLIDRVCAAQTGRSLFARGSFSLIEARKNILHALKAVLDADETLTKMEDSYSRMQFLLLASAFYKGDPTFSGEASKRALSAINAITDYYFDNNGVCVFEQVSAQHGVLKRLGDILKFVEANGFEQSKDLSKLRRRFDEIRTAAGYLSRPDRITPNIGHSSHRKVAVAPLSGNFIKLSSNIVVLSAGPAYITIGGGSNIHSAYRHCDLLSFTFWYAGRQMIWDAGGGKGSLSDYARSVWAHSALICDGLDYITPGYSDWTALDGHRETEDYVLITGRHRLIDGVTLTRTWLWIKPNVIVVLDEGASASKHDYAQNFLLPSCDPRPEAVKGASGGGYGERADEVLGMRVGPVSLTITQFGGCYDLEVQKGTVKNEVRKDELRGSLIRDFKILRRGVSLAYFCRSETASFLTAIEAHAGSPGEVVVRGASLEGGRILVRLNDGRTIDVEGRMERKKKEEEGAEAT